LSVDPEDDPSRKDEIPHQGFLTAMPKRSVYRVVLLLAMLAGILYLRQKTGSISGCMANSLAPAVAPIRSSGPVKARVMVSPDPQEKSR
jgi:hypothetical protein